MRSKCAEAVRAVQSPLLRTVLCDDSDTNLQRAGRQMKKSSRNSCQPSKCRCKSRSFESTTSFTKFNHSGISSSQSSMMRTRLTCSLMLLRFLCLKQIERTTVGRRQQRAKLSLTLNAEMLHGQMVHNDNNNFARDSEVQITGKDLRRQTHNSFFVTVQRVPT